MGVCVVGSQQRSLQAGGHATPSTGSCSSLVLREINASVLILYFWSSWLCYKRGTHMQPTKWTMGVWQQTPCDLRGPHAHQPPRRAWAATQTSQAFLPRPCLSATALGQPTQKQTLPELPNVISQKGQQGLNQPRSPRAIPSSGPRGRPLSPGPPVLTQPICPEHWLEAASTQGFTQNCQTSREDIPRSFSALGEPPGELLAGLGAKPSAEK